MKAISKLKAQAREYEKEENWHEALRSYQRALSAAEDKGADVDFSVHNRIGDLHLRLGQRTDAVRHYEAAVDMYADAGLLNNAIALCNKVLRHMPGQSAIFLKLGRLSATQGFLTDARRWFLEYADAKSREGELDSAFEALDEFARMSDDPEVREMLAEQLASHGKTDAAIGQLQNAYALRTQAGQAAEADAVAGKIRELDPGASLEPNGGGEGVGGAEGADGADGASGAEDALPGLDDLGLDHDEPAGDAADELPADPEAYDQIDLAAPSEAEPSGEQAAGEPDPLPLLGPEPGADEADTDAAAPAPSADDDDGLGLVSSAEAAGIETEPEDAADDPADDAADDALLDDSDGGLMDLDLDDLGVGMEDVADEEPAGGPDEEPEPPSVSAPDAGDAALDGLPLLDEDADDAADEAPADEAPADEAPADEVPGEVALDDEPAESGDEDIEAPSLAGLGAELDDLDLPAEPEDEPEPDADAAIARSKELAAAGRGGAALDVLNDAHPELAAAGRLEDALRVASALAELAPDDVAVHQQRVEYASQVGDVEPLAAAYMALGGCLRRAGAETKAAAIYRHVLELDPDNAEASSALGAEPAEPEAPAEPEEPTPAAGSAAEPEEPATPAAPAAGPAAPSSPPQDDGGYVDLGELLEDDDLEDEGATTRFVVAQGTPTGDEDRDFAEMLGKFKQKVSENVADEDVTSHYDLGLAFKEMGLVDEAIAEFQTALRGGEEQLRVYEELGSCFIGKQQYNVAIRVLSRAEQLAGVDDEDMLGVYYQLGRCYEEIGRRDEARQAYERVVGVDISFRDVSDRISGL